MGGSEKARIYADVIYGWCELCVKWSLFGILFVMLFTERVFLFYAHSFQGDDFSNVRVS